MFIFHFYFSFQNNIFFIFISYNSNFVFEIIVFEFINMSFGDIVGFSSVKNFVIVELKINNISSQILLFFFFLGSKCKFWKWKGSVYIHELEGIFILL